jgi:5-methylcytosine-specific restriction endonuclease McrA
MSRIDLYAPVPNYPTCDHASTSAVIRTLANGAQRLEAQCDRCGRSTAISKNDPRGADAIPYRQEVVDAWSESCRRFYASRDEQARAEKEEADREWRRRYHAHLASDAWRALRRKVIEREGNLCQGCRESPGHEVHHVTYKRLGHELLTDLVLFCRACHARHHDHGEAAE